MAKTKPSQRKDAPSPAKARTILQEGVAQGHALTPKQRGFFAAVAAKAKKG